MSTLRFIQLSVVFVILLNNASIGYSDPTSSVPPVSSNETCEATDKFYDIADAKLDQGNELRRTDAIAAQWTLAESVELFLCIHRKALSEKNRDFSGKSLFKLAQAYMTMQEWQKSLQLHKEVYQNYSDTPYVRNNLNALQKNITVCASRLAQVSAVVLDERDFVRRNKEATVALQYPIPVFEIWLRGKKPQRLMVSRDTAPLIVNTDALGSLEVRASGYWDLAVDRKFFQGPQKQLDAKNLLNPPLYTINIEMMRLPLYARWWFWTIIGVGVTAGIGAVILGSQPRNPIVSLE